MTNFRFQIQRWLLVHLAALGIAFAQVSGGAFRGEVRDSSNALVPHARITIRSHDTGVELAAASNSEGIFVSPTLNPGSYVLTAVKDGFQTQVFGPVSLEVNQTVRVDFTLTVGEASDSVTVQANGAQLLSTDSAEISQVIGSTQVSEIPLNGRAWQQLIALSAGVNPGAPGESGSPNPVNVNGQRTKANLYLVDGISTTSSAAGRSNDFNIPLEAVREFSVQSGAYSAEYGNVAGGVINLQSNYGTNNWHGSLFEFFRNDALDAANFFSNATGQPKNALRYNQFGGSIGGPIRHDKTFFFADYQGTVTHNGEPMVTSLPNDAWRSGDFSGLKNAQGVQIPIYDPFGASIVRSPFPNNKIPASLIDPAAGKITSLLPEPNQYGPNGQPLPFNNFAVTRTAQSDVQSFDIRVDHQFSERSTAFVRDSFQNTSAVSPSIFGPPLGGPPSLAGTTNARSQNAGLGWIYQLRPTLINEVRTGVNREATSLLQEDYGKDLSEQFGIPGVNRSPETSGLSNISIAGLFGVGGSLLTPLRLATTDWNLSEKLTWVKGRHTLRFGFDYQNEMGSTGYLVFGRGSYTFLDLSTSSLVGTPGGNAYASFLTGAPLLILRDTFPPGLVGMLSWRSGVFVQDDIKVNSRLTVNLGARYDIMPYAREMHDRLSNFDPATRTMLLAGSTASERLRATDYKDIAPRVGLAYAPGKGQNTVIRAGYGIGYIDPFGAAGVLNSNEFNIPFYFRDNITEFPFLPPQYKLSSRLPDLAIPPASAPTGDLRYLTPYDRNQYSQTWSLSVQQAISPALMFEVGYVGTSGNRLLTTNNINAAPPGTTDPTTRRPFGPTLGEIRDESNSAHSIYHGLQARIEKRLSHGLFFLGSYTWSKSIDNQSNGTDDTAAGGQYPQNPLNAALDRGLSSFDRTHRFVGSAVWEIPFTFSKSLGSNSLDLLLDRVLGGWQLSGVFTAQTGSPFSVLMPCAAINADGNNCRPDRIASGTLPSGQQSISEWFDTSAFVLPATPAYGDAGRDILRGPGTTNLDLGVFKSVPWGRAESNRLQFRSEFFNVFNHANFGLPVSSTDSPAFGTITSAAPGREIQFGARVIF